MPVWIEVFIVVAALALTIQTTALVTIVVIMLPIGRRVNQVVSDLQAKIDPILANTNRILADSEDRIKSIMGDAAEITHTARSQAQRVDRVFTDAVERLRLQVIRADHIVTGALEVVEDTGVKVRKSVLTPVNQVSAVLKGLKVGLDVIRGHRSRSSGSDGVTQDEELFI
jgi:hypothetical protein